MPLMESNDRLGIKHKTKIMPFFRISTKIKKPEAYPTKLRVRRLLLMNKAMYYVNSSKIILIMNYGLIVSSYLFSVMNCQFCRTGNS